MNRAELNRIPMTRGLRYIIVLSAAVLFSACGDGSLSDLEDFVKEVKSREQSAIEPMPEFKTVESFQLDTSDLRNPFMPTENTVAPDVLIASNGIKPDIARPREDLESYSLDSLRMVGTVTMASKLWALIEADDGTIHRVQNGNYMGQNHGQIIRILENQIELMEILPDPASLGNWRNQQASVKLAE
ncbi:MAG: pilus assembly protein PilP [Methylococcales bacterium]